MAVTFSESDSSWKAAVVISFFCTDDLKINKTYFSSGDQTSFAFVQFCLVEGWNIALGSLLPPKSPSRKSMTQIPVLDIRVALLVASSPGTIKATLFPVGERTGFMIPVMVIARRDGLVG